MMAIRRKLYDYSVTVLIELPTVLTLMAPHLYIAENLLLLSFGLM